MSEEPPHPFAELSERRLTKFKVAIVEHGKEALWRGYWVEGASSGSADDAPPGLGRTVVVEAASVNAAIDLVTREYPNCAVMLAGAEHKITEPYPK